MIKKSRAGVSKLFLSVKVQIVNMFGFDTTQNNYPCRYIVKGSIEDV